MPGKDSTLVNIGFGNTVVTARIVAIVTPGSAPMKRLREDAKNEQRLVDATHGRKTRAIIVTDSNHIILSAVQPETLSQRFFGDSAPNRNHKDP
jgi:extracellular matrix regulatory protein A